MNFVANENVPLAAVEALRAAGHDVLWVRDASPGLNDRGVMEISRDRSGVLLTFDKDFGELVFARGLGGAAGVILFRFAPKSPTSAADSVAKAVATREDWAGHFSVVTEHRIRMVPLRQPGR
jgi:predicted nuclease of predicted toxin-antitoxin system